MASKEAHDRVKQDLLHMQQVEAGLIPADSPPDFTVPQPTDDKGLPWWFGPDYKPTEAALESFAESQPDVPPGASPTADTWSGMPEDPWPWSEETRNSNE